MPHWQRFLAGQSGIVIAEVKSTTRHLDVEVADALSLHNSPVERIEIK